MRPVQFILFLLVLLVVYLYFSRLRSGLLDRIVVLVFAALGLVMTAFPDHTTRVANAVGVGRGADLLFYLAFLGLGFICLLLYSKLRDLESSITVLTRTIAIKKATRPDNTEDET